MGRALRALRVLRDDVARAQRHDHVLVLRAHSGELDWLSQWYFADSDLGPYEIWQFYLNFETHYLVFASIDCIFSFEIVVVKDFFLSILVWILKIAKIIELLPYVALKSYSKSCAEYFSWFADRHLAPAASLGGALGAKFPAILPYLARSLAAGVQLQGGINYTANIGTTLRVLFPLLSNCFV